MRTLIATLLASAPLQVLAQGTEPAAVAAVGNVGGGSLALQLGQLALGLGFVVGLIVLLGWLLRRVGPLAAQGGQHIRREPKHDAHRTRKRQGKRHRYASN